MGEHYRRMASVIERNVTFNESAGLIAPHEAAAERREAAYYRRLADDTRERSAGDGELAPYEDIPGVPDKPASEVGPLERSCDHPKEAWGWELPDRYGGGTASYARRSMQRDLRGIAFADAILAQRAEVEGWLRERAESPDRAFMEGVGQDGPELLRKFFPTVDPRDPDLPDPGAVWGRLHSVLDRLGGYPGRSYAH